MFSWVFSQIYQNSFFVEQLQGSAFLKSPPGQLLFHFPGRDFAYNFPVQFQFAINRELPMWCGLQSRLYLLSLKNTSFV